MTDSLGTTSLGTNRSVEQIDKCRKNIRLARY